jgi:hypothetical protein
MPGLLRGIARTAVVAGTASTVAGRVNHRQQQKWAAQDEPQYQEAPPQQAAAPAPPAPAEDPLAKLKELGELRDQGVLTDEEFTQQKTLILNG